MIRSMTGYGQAYVEVPQARITVSLRTVNHRYADVRLRLPAGLAAHEAELRRKILGKIKRGIAGDCGACEGRDRDGAGV